ncbi:META domain-containing protein [Aliarcobacter skirrowii]|uniref:META domain-containing protein n=1 Tax=Aliarcobacter skirrowii TaxID=28200 RepID=UPI00384E139F
MGSTMMMCQNMETEQNFLKILEEVKNYKIDNNILIFFSDENKELAKFIKE